MNHVVGTHESEYNDKMDYVEAWEPNNPAFRGFTEKVWTPSASPTYVSKVIADVQQRYYSWEEATTS